MNINGKTHLFDNLNFDEAVAVYWRVIDEARKIDGPAPNHCKGWTTYGREDTRKRHGYLLEELPFLGFIIEKGNGSSEFFLTRERLFPQNWSPRECVAQVNCSRVKSAADVAESVLGYVMEVELDSMLPSAAYYEVSVKDTTKIGGYVRSASSMKEAMTIKSTLEGELYSRERGNVVTEAIVTVNGLGAIIFPAYGRPRFIPNPQHRPAISDRRFAEIVTAYSKKQVTIRQLWGYITSKYVQNNDFCFGDTSYIVSANPNAKRDPGLCQITRHYLGSGSYVDFFEALDSGLLEAWATSLGYHPQE